ncbi:peptide/nickel transport system ATP-binding protein [Arthrobacter bambusae]|uniref:Peptide/nickel transport system ATP-binding protein n=1 Tax=Arthrobacter bambusae TaxID=1338426 RepID=A0AAW8DNV7_9MICC|nr:peptide/nickel transport system ATP-binding protein [Arthrobacter bambusae]MDQ0132090.1 peptide/nickel transport system ATP-binding protein [Arthrobacter bambusae]MDQ0183432.1 peptide/nickel transport system ATP-binding protein [Arthrobacter bambusae]
MSYDTGRAKTEVLHGVSLTVGVGETVAIVGESGSGKSTTAQSVVRLLPGRGSIDGGRILLKGTDIGSRSDRQMRAIRGARISLIPQDPMASLNPLIKIGRQVAEALAVHGHLSEDPTEQVIQMLGEAGLPNASRVAQQFPHQLSGGMRQRVLIAIALACKPELVIADEPTSALDVTVQKHILDYVSDRTASIGASMLLITHDLGVAADRAHRLVVMNKGVVVEDGPTDQVLGSPSDPYTRRLLAAAPGLSSAVLYSPLQGWPELSERKPLLKVTDLRKTFRTKGGMEVKAVNDVSFDVFAGETVGIVGESGSGKSTAARILLRLEQADKGSIQFDGTAIEHTQGRALRALRREMQMVYQNPFGSLSPHLTVGQAIAEPLLIHRIGRRAEHKETAAELLKLVSLDESYLERSPATLSGGQRQRVAIARALALSPRLVVLDEAVSALDVSVQAQILELLARIQQERGVSFLFISHDLAVIRQIAHRVVVMRNGCVVEQGPTQAVFGNPHNPYTRALLSAIPGRTLTADLN